MFTCLEEDVYTGLAGTVVVAGSDVDSVHLSAWQLGQRAVGVCCFTCPDVPGRSRGRHQEGGGQIRGRPGHQRPILLARHLHQHIAGDAGRYEWWMGERCGVKRPKGLSCEVLISPKMLSTPEASKMPGSH